MITPRSPVTVPAQFRIGFSRPSPLTVHAWPVGEIDLATADMLSNALLCVLREQAPAILDVDLAGVTFLDCSGISALVAVRNRAARTGRQVTVSNPQPNVRRILQMTGLLDAFTAPIELVAVRRLAIPAWEMGGSHKLSQQPLIAGDRSPMLGCGNTRYTD